MVKPFQLPLMPRRTIWSVSDLTVRIRDLLAGEFTDVFVEGEVSNAHAAQSGHLYFTLKDNRAQIRCVCFRTQLARLKFRPEDGLHVTVRGSVSVYESRGEYQFYVEHVEPVGLGALQLAFDQLKKRLDSEGLFDPARKKSLPVLPQCVGVITSPSGAAVRDIVRILQRRFPNLHVVLYPVRVQGDGAAGEIVQAIRYFDRKQLADVLILARGGGSLEDLWAFNEETVARAIVACAIPIITGVGHETDFTIADFAADQRAATPTAAAQLATPDRDELRQHLRNQARHLARAHQRRLESAMQQIDFLQRRLVHPAQKIEQQAQHLAHLQSRLRMARPNLARLGAQQTEMQRRLRAARPNLPLLATQQAELGRRLRSATGHRLETGAARLAAMQQHLAHLDPAQVLARGYSMVRDAHGRIVSSSDEVALGARVEITFAQGWARAEVEEKGKG
jgi:exodeoxyribonuclease VII large subunit